MELCNQINLSQQLIIRIRLSIQTHQKSNQLDDLSKKSPRGMLYTQIINFLYI